MKDGLDPLTVTGYLDELDRLADQDEQAARRYGEELTELAGLESSSASELLLAGIDLILAEMCVGGVDWPEAARRIRRSRRHIERELPDEIPEMLTIIAQVEEHEGRPHEARAHWAQARELLEQQQRWAEGGAVSAALAERLEDADELVASADLWRTAADLFARDGVAADARHCAHKACVLTLRRFRAETDSGQVTRAYGFGADHYVPTYAFRPGQETEAYELAVSTREFAVRHGVDMPATELAALVGLMSADSTRPWSEISNWFAAARREYQALLEVDPRALQINLAWIDCREGWAALARHAPLTAEPLARAALKVYRAEGMSEDIEFAEMLLTAILMGEAGPDLAMIIVRNQTWHDPDAVVAAAIISVVWLLKEKRYSEARQAIAETRKHAAAAGTPHKGVALNACEGVIDLAEGRVQQALRSAADLERYLDHHDVELPRTAADLIIFLHLSLRHGIAEATGDASGSLLWLERLEAVLHTRGAGIYAARTAVQRAGALLRQGRAADALRTALPAVLALDAVRFSLPEADRRRRWTGALQIGFDVAFRASAALGEHRVIAELIEVARGNAIPLTRDQDSDLMAGLGNLLVEPPGPEDTITSSLDVLRGPDAVGAGEHRTSLGLPARIRTPWNTVALADYIDAAGRYLSPVRADSTVEWRINS